jgi:hypothetical protein
MCKTYESKHWELTELGWICGWCDYNLRLEPYSRYIRGEVKMSKVKWTELLAEIADREGKAVSLNIAQISEVLHITVDLLSQYSDEEIVDFVRTYGD